MDLGASDLAAMLADPTIAGTPIVLGGDETTCIFEAPDQKVWGGDGGGAVLAGVRLATLRQGSLPGLAAGALVTVAGVQYKVINVQNIDDGKITHCFVTLP